MAGAPRSWRTHDQNVRTTPNDSRSIIFATQTPATRTAATNDNANTHDRDILHIYDDACEPNKRPGQRVAGQPGQSSRLSAVVEQIVAAGRGGAAIERRRRVGRLCILINFQVQEECACARQAKPQIVRKLFIIRVCNTGTCM